MTDPRWRKASYSDNGGNCVEVAGLDSQVLVRDTKQRGAGPMLRFSVASWRRFADQVKRLLAPDPRGAWQRLSGALSCRECPCIVSGAGTVSGTTQRAGAGGQMFWPAGGLHLLARAERVPTGGFLGIVIGAVQDAHRHAARRADPGHQPLGSLAGRGRRSRGKATPTRPPPWSRAHSASSSASAGRSSSPGWTRTRQDQRTCPRSRPAQSSGSSGRHLPDVGLVEAAVQHGREGEHVQGIAARGGPGHLGSMGGRVAEGAEQALHEGRDPGLL